MQSSGANCASLVSGDELMFLQDSRSIVAGTAWGELRVELGLQPWPADSVRRVENAALCARLDSMIVAWLAGPGAGSLAGVSGTIGPVAVMRIGPTAFHVKPGRSIPVQPDRSQPYFVVDTAAPARVAFWKGTP